MRAREGKNNNRRLGNAAMAGNNASGRVSEQLAIHVGGDTKVRPQEQTTMVVDGAVHRAPLNVERAMRRELDRTLFSQALASGAGFGVFLRRQLSAGADKECQSMLVVSHVIDEIVPTLWCQ